MDAKRREELIQQVLPGACVLLLYLFLGHLPQQRAVKTKRAELERARASAVTEQTLFDSAARVRSAEQQLAEVRVDLAAERERIAELVGSFGGEGNRFLLLRRMTELCRAHGVSLLAQQEVQPSLSKLQQEVLKRVSGGEAGRGLEYRAFSLQGEYGGVVRLLEELNAEEVAAFPVSLELTAAAEQGAQHRWKLIVVL